jgi:hypothetical protein
MERESNIGAEFHATRPDLELSAEVVNQESLETLATKMKAAVVAGGDRIIRTYVDKDRMTFYQIKVAGCDPLGEATGTTPVSDEVDYKGQSPIEDGYNFQAWVSIERPDSEEDWTLSRVTDEGAEYVLGGSSSPSDADVEEIIRVISVNSRPGEVG